MDRLLDVALTHAARERRQQDPSGDEADGINYRWTREQFEAARDAGQMLEWAIVYGRYYGTPRSS
ncbi:MAG: hypothetical protein U0792_25580 [Gemmataceae bacterium]